MATLRPTFSESWYRVAELKAKLRASAQISRQFYRGDRWYVVRDPAGNQFHRLSAPAYRFVGLLDGTRTVAEAWELVGGQLADEAPTQNEVIQILSQLHSANLLESDVTPDAAVLLRRHKQMIKRQWQGRLMNILFPRIPLWDPDKFICRWMPVVRPLLSWVGAVLWLAMVGAAVLALVPEWQQLRTAAGDAIAPSNWFYMWGVFVLIKAIHELGHGFACRRFGGEVHELGVMFLVLVPAPYVDASTAWAFPNKWARIFVGAGGMLIELFVAAIMAFIWLSTQPGHLVHQLAYNAMLIASVSTVLFNANPLLRYDGYYMLADWLEIPNLRYRSTEYTMGLFKRHLFKVKNPQPLPPVGQRIWLTVYAITSAIYRTMIGIFIILMVWNQVPVLGQLMALGGVATWVLVPVFKTLKYLTIDPELHRKRTGAALWVTGAAAAAVVLVGLVPAPMSLVATGVAEPVQETTLHPRVPGFVEKVLARDGQWLTKGQVILVCQDPQLEAQVAQMQAELSAEQAQWRAATVDDQTERDKFAGQMKSTREKLAQLLQRQADLTMRAPQDGVLVAPHIEDAVGRYLKQTDEVATVADYRKLRVTTLVDQDDAALLLRMNRGTAEKPAQATVHLVGQQSRDLRYLPVLKGTIEKWLPVPTVKAPSAALTAQGGGDAAADPSDPKGEKLQHPQFQIWVALDNPGEKYVPGQRAYVRFEMDKRTLAWQWTRRIWQLILSRANSKWT